MKEEKYEWKEVEVPPPNTLIEIEVKLRDDWQSVVCSVSHLGYRTKAKRVKVHEYETEPIKDKDGYLVRMHVKDTNVVRWRHIPDVQ